MCQNKHNSQKNTNLFLDKIKEQLLSLIDQFEVQFNELSNFELSDGALTEVQPVEIAGVVNQEINRLEGLLKEFD